MNSADIPNVEDFKCPICMEILIEPVTMPCHHELCMPCFDQHVQQTSLSCPICRIRISNWARAAVRDSTLINEERWSFIKTHFDAQVKCRLANVDDPTESNDGPCASNVHLADPGEIRREYEDQLRRYREERAHEIQLEEKESMKTIADLEHEEAVRLQVEEADNMVASEVQKAFLREGTEASQQETPQLLERAMSDDVTKVYSAFRRFNAGKPARKPKIGTKRGGDTKERSLSPEEKEKLKAKVTGTLELEAERLDLGRARSQEPPVGGSRLVHLRSKSSMASTAGPSQDSVNEERTNRIRFEPIDAAPISPPKVSISGHFMESPLLHLNPIRLLTPTMNSKQPIHGPAIAKKQRSPAAAAAANDEKSCKVSPARLYKMKVLSPKTKLGPRGARLAGLNSTIRAALDLPQTSEIAAPNSSRTRTISEASRTSLDGLHSARKVRMKYSKLAARKTEAGLKRKLATTQRQSAASSAAANISVEHGSKYESNIYSGGEQHSASNFHGDEGQRGTQTSAALSLKKLKRRAEAPVYPGKTNNHRAAMKRVRDKYTRLSLTTARKPSRDIKLALARLRQKNGHADRLRDKKPSTKHIFSESLGKPDNPDKELTIAGRTRAATNTCQLESAKITKKSLKPARDTRVKLVPNPGLVKKGKQVIMRTTTAANAIEASDATKNLRTKYRKFATSIDRPTAAVRETIEKVSRQKAGIKKTKDESIAKPSRTLRSCYSYDPCEPGCKTSGKGVKILRRNAAPDTKAQKRTKMTKAPETRAVRKKIVTSPTQLSPNKRKSTKKSENGTTKQTSSGNKNAIKRTDEPRQLRCRETLTESHTRPVGGPSRGSKTTADAHASCTQIRVDLVDFRKVSPLHAPPGPQPGTSRKKATHQPPEKKSRLNADFLLALKLQEEFDLEARRASMVDRSKGSQDEYSLRKRSL